MVHENAGRIFCQAVLLPTEDTDCVHGWNRNRVICEIVNEKGVYLEPFPIYTITVALEGRDRDPANDSNHLDVVDVFVATRTCTDDTKRTAPLAVLCFLSLLSRQKTTAQYVLYEWHIIVPDKADPSLKL